MCNLTLLNARSSQSQKTKPLNTKYLLHNVELEIVSAAKYLGVTITDDDFSWTKHIDITTKKANQTLGFLKRNIGVHNKDLKSVTYKTFVGPQLEYASTVWYPHTTTDIKWKQSNEGLQGGLQETTDTPLVSLLC